MQNRYGRSIFLFCGALLAAIGVHLLLFSPFVYDHFLQTTLPITSSIETDQEIGNLDTQLTLAGCFDDLVIVTPSYVPSEHQLTPAKIPLPSMEVSRVSPFTQVVIPAPPLLPQDSPPLAQTKIHYQTTPPPLPNPPTPYASTLSQKYRMLTRSIEFDWNHLFTYEIELLPSSQKEGTHFSITLTPTAQAASKELAQTLHFLLDETRRTTKEHILSLRNSLIKALDYLVPNQLFTISVIGEKHLRTFAEKPVATSKQAIVQAKKFLSSDRHIQGSQGQTSIYSILDGLRKSSNERVATVILLTDGSFLQSNWSRQDLDSWSRLPGSDTFILHVATAGHSSHDPALDAMTALHGGRVVHSTTHAAFPRKLAKLLMDIRSPIVTGLAIDATPNQLSAKIRLQQHSYKLPPLFASQPTTFFCTTDGSTPFTLHLQGWNGSQPISLDYDIDLSRVKQHPLRQREVKLHSTSPYKISLFFTKDTQPE